jgi:hypothetical protein
MKKGHGNGPLQDESPPHLLFIDNKTRVGDEGNVPDYPPFGFGDVFANMAYP